MSEGNTTPDPSAGKQTGEPTVDTLKAELAARDEEIVGLRKKHDTAFTSLRRLETEMESLKSEKSNREREAATKSGDIEALRRSSDEQILAAKKDAEDARKELHSVIVEKEVRALAAKHAVDDADVWLLLKDKFQLGKDDKGNLSPVVVDSVLSPEQFILKFLEAKPHLAKNPRSSGSGSAERSSASSGGSTITIEQLNRMSDAEYAEAVKKNPELAKQWLKSRNR